jgi:hypothetical protein
MATRSLASGPAYALNESLSHRFNDIRRNTCNLLHPFNLSAVPPLLRLPILQPENAGRCVRPKMFLERCNGNNSLVLGDVAVLARVTDGALKEQ